MAYVNLASATKLARASRIITDIGSSGLMKVYTGSVPASPDLTVTDTLLASLALSSTAGVASLAVQDVTIANAGTSGTNGTYALSFTGGGGTGAAGIYTVSGNVITSATISNPGHGYTSAPTIGGFDAPGLVGASILPVMTGMVTFNAITTATAVGTGIAGYARVCKSSGTPVIDLDIGTTNDSSVVINNTTVISGGSVSCSAEVLIEA